MGKKFMGLGGTDHFWDRAKAWILNQITSAVAAKIAEVVADAPEDLDTLKEIADWIKNHANDAAAMNTQITENKSNIATNTSDISAMNTQIQTNKNNIAANTSDISAMNTQIQTNKDNIAANTSDISALKTSVAGKAAASHTHDDRYFTETEVTKKLEDYQAKEWKVLDGYDISGIDFDEVAVSIWFSYDGTEVLYSKHFSKGMLGATQILMVGGYFSSSADYGLCNLNFTNGRFSKRNIFFSGINYTSVAGLKIRYR